MIVQGEIPKTGQCKDMRQKSVERQELFEKHFSKVTELNQELFIDSINQQ